MRANRKFGSDSRSLSSGKYCKSNGSLSLSSSSNCSGPASGKRRRDNRSRSSLNNHSCFSR